MMRKMRTLTISILILITLSSGILFTQVSAFDLDPGGGNGIVVNTTFKVFLKDTQSGTGLQGITVKLKLGSSVLQTAATNSAGQIYFNTVTDGGNTDYHIIVQTTAADPGYTDRKVTSSGVAGTYLTTVQINLNKIVKWAVLVGLGDWSDNRFGDTSGQRDANDWYNRLTALGYHHITTLGDATHTYDDPNMILATKDNMKQAVNNVVDNADNNDVVIFTFATHNTIAGLACWDSKYYRSLTYFKGSWFGDKVRSCDADRILVWIHSCSAGGFIEWATGTHADSNTLWMGSSKSGQKSFNDNFRRDFWEHTDLLGGLSVSCMETIFNCLSTEYPKTSGTLIMEPVMYDGNKQVPFVLY